MQRSVSLVTLQFSTFEELSSKLILLPLHDDTCTGAKVGSHEVCFEEQTNAVLATEQLQSRMGDDHIDNGGDFRDIDLNEGGGPPKLTVQNDESNGMNHIHERNDFSEGDQSESGPSEPHSNLNSSCPEGKPRHGCDPDKLSRQISTAHETSDISDAVDENNWRGDEKALTRVPAGFVLIKISSSHQNNTSGAVVGENPETNSNRDLEKKEFGYLLSVLREASYPLLLSFAPPVVSPKIRIHDNNPSNNIVAEDKNPRLPTRVHDRKGSGTDSNHITSSTSTPSSSCMTSVGSIEAEEQLGDTNSNNRPNGTKHSETHTTDPTLESSDVPMQNLSVISSREDAAKYAKAAAAQAATELRGRLSRWGLQAASRAAVAASAVQEMREERHRKLKGDVEKENQNKDPPMNAEKSDRHVEEKQISRDLSARLESLHIDTKAATLLTSLGEQKTNNYEILGGNVGETIPSQTSPITFPCSSCNQETLNLMEPCLLFLQTSSGFVPLPPSQSKFFNGEYTFEPDSNHLSKSHPQSVKTEKEKPGEFVKPSSSANSSPRSFSSPSSDPFPIVTNTSVISVRLSKEKACPVGKHGGYTFQWYRSNNFHRKGKNADLANEQLDSTSHDRNQGSSSSNSTLASSITWSVLPGACHAAYQPSSSDVGHQLRCVIEFHSGRKVDRQTCVLPRLVSIDPSLFDAAKSILSTGKNSTAFGSLVGIDGARGRTFRLRIAVNKREIDECIISSSVFIDQVSGGSVEPLHDPSEPIRHVIAAADPARPRSFDLTFPSGLPPSASLLEALSEASNGRLRLDAPNRVSRESLLLTLGIANFRGHFSTLTTETILFPQSNIQGNLESENEKKDVCYFPSKSSTYTKEYETSPPAVITIDLDSSTNKPDLESVGSKNVCGEKIQPDPGSKYFEKEISELKSLLASKEIMICELQQKLTTSGVEKRKIEKDLQSAHETNRQSLVEVKKYQEKLESANKKISTLMALIEEKEKVMDNSTKIQHEKEMEYEKNIKALHNEKAVMSAAIEARDGKINASARQISEQGEKIASQIKQLAEFEALKDELNRTRTKCTTADSIIAKMKKEEVEIQNELKKARIIIEDMDQRFVASKDAATRLSSELEKVRSDCRKLKIERNSFKHKADGLSKEMSRIFRNDLIAVDVEKMQEENKEIKKENAELQEQLTEALSQKRDAISELEVTRLAHQQSVSYQQSVNATDGARAVEQRAELERIVSEMTEYLNAKEMQIDTLKQANTALTKEIDQISRQTF